MARDSVTYPELLERWILDPSPRTYHEWVAREAAHIDALVEYEERDMRILHAIALRANEAMDAEVQRRADLVSMVDRRLSEVPPQYRQGDTWMLEGVWRTRADILRSVPWWWHREDLPTILPEGFTMASVWQSSGMIPAQWGYPRFRVVNGTHYGTYYGA